MKPVVKNIFEELFIRYSQLEQCKKSIEKAFYIMKECYENGMKVLVCGNGGSAADSEHIVGELMKGFLLKRPLGENEINKIRAACPKDWEYLTGHLQGAIPAISLVSQTAVATAFVNDIAADMVYAQQVYGYGKSGDVLIGLSTSGNSKNVVNAVKVARGLGVNSICMTGESGGMLKELSGVTIQVPETETYKIQEYHLPVYHTLCAMLEAEIFNS